VFHMSYSTPHKGEVKTLRLTRDPFRYGLGHYTDTDGNVWDVYALMGKTYTGCDRSYINARRVHPSMDYYSTATNASSDGFHKWEPYYIEVVPKDGNRAQRRGQTSTANRRQGP